MLITTMRNGLPTGNIYPSAIAFCYQNFIYNVLQQEKKIELLVFQSHAFPSEFFFNVSLNSANLVTKMFLITVKGLEPAFCVRVQDTTTAPAGHM